MGIKRVSGLRRSYRLARGFGLSQNAVPESPEESLSPLSIESPCKQPQQKISSCSQADVILNTDGVSIGWLLDNSRGHSKRMALSYPGMGGASFPCSPCIHASYPHYWTIGRVKFGVPLEQVCKNEDIPGPLLVLILKLNKEGPSKKDVFRAPGHQASMKKLIHFLHNGRLVNIDNFSVYTIASVLKKFLRKLPEGVFGREGEQELFRLLEFSDTEQKRELVQRLVKARPLVAQHLLVLLFGTFRVIANNAERGGTGMTSEALGVSVAPSFFRSCVAHGKTASMDDVLRFKAATRIMQFMIDNFGVSNLFGRENYEYYARITGRILRVEEDWIFAYRYPKDSLVARQLSLEAERSWLRAESERWGLKFNLEALSSQEESHSTPALVHVPEYASTSSPKREAGTSSSSAYRDDQFLLMDLDREGTSSRVCGSSLHGVIVPENGLRESHTRLSISLEENGLYKTGGSSCLAYPSGGSSSGGSGGGRAVSGAAPNHLTLEELRQVNHFAENTKSLSFLPQVHERQTERMRTRSEWFLTPQQLYGMRTPTSAAATVLAAGSGGREGAGAVSQHLCPQRSGDGTGRKHGSDECRLLRRSSSKDKERRLVRRSSSKKDKENGQKKRDALRARSSSAEVKGHPFQQQSSSPSVLHNIPTGALQLNVMFPLTPLQQQAQQQHFVRPLQQQQLSRPLLQQRSHDVLLVTSPSRRVGADPSEIVAECSISVNTDEQVSEATQLLKPGVVTELDCTETDVHTIHVSNTYKPRI